MRFTHGIPLLAAAGCLVVSNLVCTDINSVADPDEVLLLTSTRTSLPADGFSTTVVTAEISPNTNERYRDVIFTTTLGRFPASSTPTRAVVTADTNGRASVVLQASPQAGTATVTAEIRDDDAVKVARTIDIPFEQLASSDVIQIRAASPTAPADGATVTNILAEVSRTMPFAQREILFTTTAGTFGLPTPQSTVVYAGSNGQAIAGLTSPRQPSVALVTATVNNYQSQTTVQFEHAFPDKAALSVFGSLQLKATFATKVSLNVELFRDIGQVTEGTEVTFRAFDDATGTMFGFFSGVTPSDRNGIVTAEFTPGNTIVRGEATIRARVTGTEVSARVKVEIVDP